MKKKFVSNLLFLVVLNLIVKPFYILGIDAGVQNAVGATEYGLYFALFSLTFLLNIFSDMGITNFNNRHIAQNRQLMDKHFSKILSLRIAMIALYILIALVAGFFLGYSPRMMKLLGWIVINQALASFILYLRSNLSGLHLFKRDSIISVLDRFLLIIFCGYVLWGRSSGKPFQIEWFIWLQTLSYLITVVVAFFMVMKQVKTFRFGINKVFSMVILKQSLPYALLILMMGLYHRMDSIMLERMLPTGSEASGIYAQGFRFLDALNNFSFLFAVLLLPIFARMIKERIDVSPVLLVASKILLSGVIIASITAFFHSYNIMQWRYNQHIEAAALTFSVLILSAVFFAIVLIFGTLLTADGKLRQLNYIAITGVALNFTFNLVLIPRYFELGSAIATIGTQIITSLAHLFVAKKYFKLSINGNILFKLCILTGSMVGLSFITGQLNMYWIIQAGLQALSGIGVAITLKLLDIGAFIALVKSEKQEKT